MKLASHQSEIDSVARRIKAVLMTYLTNRWQWVLILLALILLVTELCIPHWENSTKQNYTGSETLRPGFNHLMFGSYENEDLSRHDKTDLLMIRDQFIYKLGDIAPADSPNEEDANPATPSSDPSEQKSQIPVHPETGRVILEHRAITADDLARLSSLPHLETIHFWYVDIANLKDALLGLRKLPQLKTLILQSVHRKGISDEVLEAIAGLPHLETLVLDFIYDNPYFNAANSYHPHFQILNKSTSLKTIYVGGYRESFRNDYYAARKQLPRMTVLHAYLPEYAEPTWLLLVPPLFILSFLIGNILAHQYRTAASRLVPRFHIYHISVALVLIVLITVYCAARMYTRWIDLPLALTFAGTIFALGIGSQTIDYTARRKQLRVWIFLGVGFGIFLSSPYLTSMYLVNELYAWLIVGYLTIFAVATITTFMALRRLAMTSESGIGTVSGKKVHVKKADQLQVSNDRETPVRRRELAIDQLKPAHDLLTFWQRVSRWQLGNRPNPVRWYMYIVLPIALSLITHLVLHLLNAYGDTNYDKRIMYNSTKAQLICYGLLMPLAAVVGTATFWRARRFLLPIEVLRPVWTANVTREWIAGILLDVIPVSILSALWPAFIYNIEIDKSASISIHWEWIPAYFLFFALVQTAACTAIAITAILVDRILVWFTMCVGLLVVAVPSIIMAMNFGLYNLDNIGGARDFHYETLTLTLHPGSYFLLLVMIVAMFTGIGYALYRGSSQQPRQAIVALLISLLICGGFYWWLTSPVDLAELKIAHHSHNQPVQEQIAYANIQYFFVIISCLFLFITAIAIRRWISRRNFDFRT